MFSKRTNWETQPNPLSQSLSKLRKKGETVFDLTESNPTRCGFQYLNSKILETFSNSKNLSYEPDSRGLLEARTAICGYYSQKGITLKPDQVFLTASTSEAYTHLFRLLANSGDKMLVPGYGYPLFGFLAELNDVELTQYALSYDTAWHIDFSSLRGNNTRAVIVVNPNNPTGNFIHKYEKKMLNEFCQANQSALISDEVFLDYAYEENFDRVPSFAGNDSVLTFTLSGVSKILGLPQMKLSWIVVNGPREKKDKAIERLEIISDTYLSVSTPSQRALSSWLQLQPEIQKEILSRVLENRDLLKKTMSGQNKIKILNTEGGWYAVLEIDSSRTDEEIALGLLEKDHVYVHPGYFFDFHSGTFLVLSLLPPKDIFQEGIRRLSENILY